MMHEAEDEPLFAERAAGIDIAKAGIEVTVRVPSGTRRGGRQQETRSFSSPAAPCAARSPSSNRPSTAPS
jgi:hypothetical protein